MAWGGDGEAARLRSSASKAPWPMRSIIAYRVTAAEPGPAVMLGRKLTEGK
jgi:hypothetical protein